MMICNSLITDDPVRSKQSKRKDPNYTQLIGDIPVALATEFKALCVLNHLTVSDGMEEAIKNWVKDRKAENPFKSE
jgi:hypothetical protein